MVQKKKALNRLSKFMAYVLGRHPDEFGLVPDPTGYVKMKELLKAVCEEEGYRHIRKSHLDEILISLPEPPIEIEGTMIRAKHREHLPKPVKTTALPKHLYTCIRKRAHSHILENDITPMGIAFVVMSASKEMAERMGKRIDPEPVLLTVQSEKSMERNVQFYRMGDNLFLADTIPCGCFIAPPLPKQPTVMKVKEKDIEKKRDPRPGSYPITPAHIERRGTHKGKKEDISWKRELRKSRRQKQRRQ
ncbi:MAG: RNA 2'-phosphotransferase [Deltaproteobacteria bacterium]|nr:RNA 2'-phosphotransferase [Deltaproteobacteria bacterium]